MVVPNQGRPFGEWLGIPVGLARLALDGPRSCLSPAVRVGSRIERVGKKRQEVVIDGQLPQYAAFRANPGRSREGDLLTAEPQ